MDLYFRIKDNGATVFRINDETRQRRLDLQPVAKANVRNGDIKLRKDVTLSDAELSEVYAWLDARSTELQGREIEQARLTIEQLNTTANWISSKPDEALANAISEDLLMAMHDLRTAIVRFKSKMLDRKDNA
jgi:hypothetical protein